MKTIFKAVLLMSAILTGNQISFGKVYKTFHVYDYVKFAGKA